MAEPFISEIRLMSFVFPPRGWALCNGQLLPIASNQALYSLIGTTYGGDGRINFALPDARGRVPLHYGPSKALGDHGGEPQHVVSLPELPTHLHVLGASSAQATSNDGSAGKVLAASTGSQLYGPASNLTGMSAQVVESVGGSQAHDNMQPYLTLSFCIALQGIYPSRN